MQVSNDIITVRNSRQTDEPAIAAIYAQWVRHGIGSFEYELPDEAEIARRLSAALSGGYPISSLRMAAAESSAMPMPGRIAPVPDIALLARIRSMSRPLWNVAESDELRSRRSSVVAKRRGCDCWPGLSAKAAMTHQLACTGHWDLRTRACCRSAGNPADGSTRFS